MRSPNIVAESNSSYRPSIISCTCILSTASTEFQHFGLPISLNISFKSKGNESQVLKWRIERPLRLRFSMSVARTQKEITYQRERRKHCEEREKHRDTPRRTARTVILWVLSPVSTKMHTRPGTNRYFPQTYELCSNQLKPVVFFTPCFLIVSLTLSPSVHLPAEAYMLESNT